MNTVLQKVGRLLRQIRGLFPEALPQGMTEFEKWSESLIATYALPTQDKDSIKYVLATIIMRLGPNAAYASKFGFVLKLRAAGAKQIASAKFQEIKLRSEEAQQKAKTEATKLEVVADGQKR